MDIRARDTVAVGDITDDGIDECDILLARPAVGRSTRESRRVGDDEVALSVESHVVLYHGIIIRPPVYSDDESCGTSTTIARWHGEDIAPRCACRSHAMGATREGFRIFTSC